MKKIFAIAAELQKNIAAHGVCGPNKSVCHPNMRRIWGRLSNSIVITRFQIWDCNGANSGRRKIAKCLLDHSWAREFSVVIDRKNDLSVYYRCRPIALQNISARSV